MSRIWKQDVTFQWRMENWCRRRSRVNILNINTRSRLQEKQWNGPGENER